MNKLILAGAIAAITTQLALSQTATKPKSKEIEINGVRGYQDTPLELVRLLEPDVIVKGGDYTPGSVVGAADVTARGGRVVIIPVTPGHSTTSTIEKLRG